MTDYDAWDRRTVDLLEDAYVAAGSGPPGSGAGSSSEGAWRAKRQQLSIPMDRDGSWLDVGCANGHLLATLPIWAHERGIDIEPHGLELLPRVAEAARSQHPALAERIWTGSVMSWEPPQRFTYVTALEDAVPPDALALLVDRLLDHFVEPGGRLILSCYSNRNEPVRPLYADLAAIRHPPDGRIHIDRPGKQPIQTAWLDR
ncbi:MAG: hypothetical protein AAF567_16185 [Actinomycetota bacterium]